GLWRMSSFLWGGVNVGYDCLLNLCSFDYIFIWYDHKLQRATAGASPLHLPAPSIQLLAKELRSLPVVVLDAPLQSCTHIHVHLYSNPGTSTHRSSHSRPLSILSDPRHPFYTISSDGHYERLEPVFMECRSVTDISYL